VALVAMSLALSPWDVRSAHNSDLTADIPTWSQVLCEYAGKPVGDEVWPQLQAIMATWMQGSDGSDNFLRMLLQASSALSCSQKGKGC